jgi:hypothetical protein
MGKDTDTAADRRREARLRRVAAGMGLALRKARTRDSARMDFGRYRIVDVKNDCVVAGRFPYGYTLSLDAVEDVLDELEASREDEAIKNEWRAVHGRGGDFDAKWDR